MAKDDVFSFDLRGFEKTLTRIERQVLPQAQAGLLNSIAFGARKSLLAYADKTIQGKPTAWTRKGFVVDKATPESLEAVVRIQPQQATYITYLINGGVRRKGDVGTTPYDVLTDAPDGEKNAFGNLKRGYLKRIARQAKAEKTKRARLATKRAKVRAAGKPTGPARWAANNAAGKPGIFFGRIGNQKGYWQRATKRDGDYNLKLLARMSDEAIYKPTFRWDDTISASIKSSDLVTIHSAEITRALRKLNDD
ncbi:hypothetical protein [Rhizobium sp. BK176]|uniref:hypothetical protein n=1 Tax=Rhizobium sp. BK176 TaxID=2587071 RepID=UPI00216960FD|nr:hypothetical protein [Rhizobium sp. BK176]MCS4092613.1 hypothetical protein [Rhizobium sp. BK176]